MADYIIATASTADLPRTWLDQHNIPFISYTYTINDDAFEDDCREESRAAVYEGMRGGNLLKTSMITEFAYYQFFQKLLNRGKHVIFLDMSFQMSASYQNSLKAAEKVRSEYSSQKLYVMDTRCISGGLGVLVDQMTRRMEAGDSFDEVIAWGEANKLKIAHRFTVDDLKYLKMGGRVSNASALVGSLLHIKPVLYVPDDGTLRAVKMVRGRKASLHAIRDGILNDLKKAGVSGTELHILHADCRADAEYIRDEVRNGYPQVGEIAITSLGVVIGAHCGPGLLTVFYLCDSRCP